jgi:hypothetical protein
MASRTLWLTARGGVVVRGDPGAARGCGRGKRLFARAGSFRRRWAFNDGMMMARPANPRACETMRHTIRRWLFLPVCTTSAWLLRAAACERRRKCRAYGCVCVRTPTLHQPQVTVRWSRSLSRSHPPIHPRITGHYIDAPFFFSFFLFYYSRKKETRLLCGKLTCKMVGFVGMVLLIIDGEGKRGLDEIGARCMA